MKLKLTLYIVLLSLTLNGVYSQKSQIAAADKKYERYAYIDAIKTYERVALKGYKSVEMFQKLGNSYYFNAELGQAEKWYGELFTMNEEQTPEYYYRYAQCLKSIGNYNKADKILSEFNAKSGNDQRAKLFNKNRNYLEVIKANSGRYTIEEAGINSEFSDYGSSFWGNKLVFTSSRHTSGVPEKISKWTNQSFLDLYSSEIKSDGVLGKPVRFLKPINTKFDESTPTFTSDGATIYFTRSNYLDGKKGKNSKQVTLLKVYKATQKEGKWKNIVELPFNDDQYSVAHPALSPDGKTLYFSSDMPGSLGQSDLYKVAINSNGSYGKPENLGATVNTPGRETFPFVSAQNELFYATDGHPGLGGLDIFVAKIGKDGTLSESENVGEPINGKTDDFALIIDQKTRTGFFSSNREAGKGYDNIYKFVETRKLNWEQELMAVVTDQDTGLVLPNVSFVLLDRDFKELKQVVSDAKGNYTFEELNCGEDYYLRASHPEYITKEQKIGIGQKTGTTNVAITLEKKIKTVKTGSDLAKVFLNKVIYFDLNKSEIRKDTEVELVMILDVMKQNTTIKIDVRSHTDSRQTNSYNNALSERRAKATVAWLIKNGISPSRLTSKGYGETQLVNACSDGVSCTEAEHQANRRSEFIIMEM